MVIQLYIYIYIHTHIVHILYIRFMISTLYPPCIPSTLIKWLVQAAGVNHTSACICWAVAESLNHHWVICDPFRRISLLVDIPMGIEAMLTAESFTFCWLSWIVIYPPLIAHSFPFNPIYFVNYPSHKSYSMGTLGPHFFPSFCKASVQFFCRGCGCLLCRVWGGSGEISPQEMMGRPEVCPKMDGL